MTRTRRSRRRDWANLPPELVDLIAGRLLYDDVSEYLRLRSACKPSRECTDDPGSCGGGLDPHFRPRDWIAVSHCSSPSRRRLINTRTGAHADVDRPELSTHRCLGVVDGLFLLCRHWRPSASSTRSPAPSSISPALLKCGARKLTPAGAFKTFFYPSEPLTEEEMRAAVIDAPKIKIDVKASAINGAGIDDSTSPPTLILAIRYKVRRIICAKPGDQY
ncbi:LOW QUALITY PROTEIN: hypothetical protein U9M48_008986 [Paspalum notatum var. saurae]|uniref:F-box domain-containing protein n=1 Tax=Paspalum notatum var. saurae TaxID=547442 RepID=A0AAQ3WED6_PASNO